MTVQKTIRNFPTPYPGECLYSLFSRYHVRSGNASFQDTAGDLFGNSMYTFRSSVTTPYRLEFVQRWYPQDTEIFAQKLLMHHTGFQYYCLICPPESKEEYYDAFCRAAFKNYKPAAHMSREISSGFHYLRYCPICAKEEIEIYGEPYWSVIAQLDGVDFCPVHGCRLCESSVTRNDTRKKLKPASEVLTKRSLAQERPVNASTLLDQECLAFSRDVIWFLNHGARLDYNTIYDMFISSFFSSYNKNVIWSHYERMMYVTKKLTGQYASAELMEKMEILYKSKYTPKEQNRINEYDFYIFFLPIKVLAIHYLSGNAENFGKAVFKESICCSDN